MNILMYNWAGTAKNLPVWFTHDQYLNDCTWQQIEELLNTGNNVMLRHMSNSKDIIVFVDDKNFGQR